MIVIIGSWEENIIYLTKCNCNMIYAALIGNYENHGIKNL